MREFFLYIFFLALFSSNPANGQNTATDTSKQLQRLFARLIDNYNDTSRVQIDDSIRTILDSYVMSDSVFTHKFSGIRYLGQITSPDSLIKIVTWNLVLGSMPGRYHSYFIRKENPGKPNRVYKLTTFYHAVSILTDTTYTESDWYGALYYDIRPFMIDSEKCWALLGIDYGNPMVSRKIIDVLSFDRDGSVLFGRKWFASGGKMKYRVIFKYAANATMTLRFSSASSIVFDHLVPFSPSHTGDYEFYGPDYSYDAYNFANGVWRFSQNIDARNKE